MDIEIGLPSSENKCQSAYDSCKARCCKGLGFEVSHMSEDLKAYYEMHEGIVVKRQVGRNQTGWIVMVLSRCKNLKTDLSCSLYGKKERPRVCKDGYTKLKKGVVYMPHCVYTPTPNSLVLTEKEAQVMENAQEIIS